MIKVMQINLNHCEIAQDILEQTTRTEKIDVCLISDPYNTRKSVNCVHDKEKLATILVRGRYPFQSTTESEEGFVRANINGVDFYSCYAPPRMSLSEYQSMLDRIVQDARSRKSVVITGDFNAWSTEWGSRTTNRRGQLLLEAFAPLDITLANHGKVTTFRRAGTSSIIDITFVANSLCRDLKWRVSEDYTNSDHQAVFFEINGRKSSTRPPASTGPKWLDRKLDTATFEVMMGEMNLIDSSAEGLSAQLDHALTEACDASMPRKTYSQRRAPCYWWNDEIKDLRKKCLKYRRLVQRARNTANFEDLLQTYKVARHELRTSIKGSKRKCFKLLCDEADVDPWGKAYKVVMVKLKGERSPQLMCPKTLENIVKTLFPARNNTLINVPEETNASNIPRLTSEEVMKACRRFKDNKTPGPDGIPNKVFKLAVVKRPDLFVKVFETCLHEGVFPSSWKTQHLVLLPKGKGEIGEPSAYRPICLCDTKGKAFEKVVYNRLLSHAENNGGLSNMQFGFRKYRSTIDAIKVVIDIASEAIEGTRWAGGSKEYCAIVTLDVKNAFNTANWSCIWKSLARMNTPLYLRKVIESYFSGRKLRYSTDEGMKYYSVSSGVPQGSVLGPLLWNIMYDGVLNLHLPPKTTIVGFADDIAVVVVGKTIQEIQEKTNESVKQIREWLGRASLQLADHKTEAVLITGRKKMEYMTIQVGNTTINSKEAVKYLGVMLDNRLNFKYHVKHATEKASKIQSTLARMLPNIGGPKYQKRILLSRVVSSALLYAAPIWSKAVIVQETKKKLSSVYRLTALRTISGYRTISEDAAYVIAGMIPIDILAEEMTRIYRRRSQLNGDSHMRATNVIKKEEREVSLDCWQNRWENSTKGRWTYELIPDIKTWLNRKHGACNYHLTQFLSGHGGYRKYLHRFGHDNSPFCPECPTNEEDTNHVVFHCPRFEVNRRNNLVPGNVLLCMMETDENWFQIESWITKIQLELRKIEKIRNERDANEDDVA